MTVQFYNQSGGCWEPKEDDSLRSLRDRPKQMLADMLQPPAAADDKLTLYR